ncbi:hypothetical protein TRFO_30201 [Tritrichomonas foetus]|uniref:Uncharacterized protein n=1 Tax=Tritrichomonas foetus TaxID=1144522 RepID=A0A1J4JZH7_9EUKA|nr:hypothetical protein TRFO_30201 [Tritrichomonas foetus]|eukprot:OHT02661.1 hypothetical protein TRFO_30201 [Tritrichomonas foetus]
MIMDHLMDDDISEVVNDYVSTKPFRTLSTLLVNYNVNDPEFEIDDSEYDELRDAYKNAQNAFFNQDLGSNPVLSNLLETIFHTSSLLQRHDDKLIYQLKKQPANNQNNTRRVTIQPTNQRNPDKFDFKKKSLKEELSRANVQIDKLRDQLDLAKEDGANEVLQTLADHYQLGLTDLNSLMKSIDELIERPSNGIVKEIIQALDLPPATTRSNIVQELQSKINHDINDNMVEHSEIPPREVDRGLNSLDNINPIEDNGPSKQELFITIDNLKNDIIELHETIQNQREILQIFSDIPMKSEEIENILNSNDTLYNKVKNIVALLTIQIFASEDAVISNAKLIPLISGLFRFISSIGSSKTSYAAIYSDTPFEDMRGLLVNQAEKIQMFLSENAMGIVEDHCLFEELIKKDNTPELLNDVRAYIADYKQPSSVESQQLFIILMEAIAAADVLRKYSNEAHQAFVRQASDVRQLKTYIRQLEKTIEDQKYLIQQQQQQMNDDITNPNKKKQNNQYNDQNNQNKDQHNDVFGDNIMANSLTEVHENEQIIDLQNQLDDAKQKNAELKKSNEKLIKQAHSDFVRVQQQVNKKKNTMTKKLSTKNKEIKKNTQALKEANQALESEKKDKIQFAKDCTELRQKKKKNEKDSKALVAEITEQVLETRREHENIVQNMKREVAEYQETKQREFETAKVSFEDLLNKAQTEIDSEKEKCKLLMRRIGQLENEVKERDEICDHLKKSEEEALDQAAKLSELYQTIHKDFTGLEGEKEIMETRLQNAEKNAQMVQGALKNHRELIETLESLRNNYDKDKNDSMREMQHLLGRIAHIFPSYTDLSVSLTPGSVLELLGRVQEKVDSIPRLERKLDKRNSILQEVKDSLKCSKDIQIPGEIKSIVQRSEQINTENSIRTTEIKALQESRVTYLQVQDWLIRMYVLCTGGVCQDVTTLQMQHTIEDVIMTSFENLVLSRKNAILRAEKKLLVSKIIEKSADLQNHNSSRNNSLNTSLSPSSSPSKRKSKRPKISMRHLLIVAMLVIKTKKLAGHFDSVYTFETLDKNPTTTGMTETDDYRFISQASNIPENPMSNFVYEYE